MISRKKRTYFRRCPDCGCNLDPGEICTCNNRKQLRSCTGATDRKLITAEQGGIKVERI